jgi:hypothetical protein
VKRAVFFFLLAACGHDEAGSMDAGVDLTGGNAIDLASSDLYPIVAPADTWTFVPVGGSVCDDGSDTGIGVRTGASDKLMVFFDGGGACGDYASCYQANTAKHGPFGPADLDAIVPLLTAGSTVFDRTDTRNPFRDYTMVWIPYCTGDLHGGRKVQTYSLGADVRTYHHVGHDNALRALDRLTATWPTLTKLVVTGASAGGYGSTVNYADFRSRWPTAESLLLDDSGPFFARAVTPQLLQDWIISWDLLGWLTAECPDCAGEITTLYPTLASRFPNDRMALLSSLQDKTIRAYNAMSGPQFEAALRATASNVLQPLPRFKYFFVSGDTHTMLVHPVDFTSGTTGLWTWLEQMAGGDPAWADLSP